MREGGREREREREGGEREREREESASSQFVLDALHSLLTHADGEQSRARPAPWRGPTGPGDRGRRVLEAADARVCVRVELETKKKHTRRSYRTRLLIFDHFGSFFSFTFDYF